MLTPDRTELLGKWSSGGGGGNCVMKMHVKLNDHLFTQGGGGGVMICQKSKHYKVCSRPALMGRYKKVELRRDPVLGGLQLSSNAPYYKAPDMTWANL